MTIALTRQLDPLESLRQRFLRSTSSQAASTSPPRRAPGVRSEWSERWKRWAVDVLLRQYPGLAVKPSRDDNLTLAGDFTFDASYDGEEITDTYSITIDVSQHFPNVLPIASEVGGRIPAGFHKLDDGSLCLGSPLRLQLLVANNCTLPSFVRRCLIPYLYGYSYKEKHGRLPFGELAHGTRGVSEDYQTIFRVNTREACERMLYLASRPRRKANCQQCPCGSGLRLGKCHSVVLNRLQKRVGRLWFRDEYARVADKRPGNRRFRAADG